MTATHNSLVQLSYSLDPAPTTAASFGAVLHLAESLTFAEPFRVYPDYPTALADSDLSAHAKAAVAVAMSQPRRPSSVLIGNVRTAYAIGPLDIDFDGSDDFLEITSGQTWAEIGVAPGDSLIIGNTSSNDGTLTVTLVDGNIAEVAESVSTESASAATVGMTQTYANALAACLAEGDLLFFGITMESRTAADQLPVSALAETTEKVCFLQSSDASCLTAGWPGALAAVEGRENTALVYHNDDSELADVAWAAARLAYDFDTTAPGSQSPLQEVAAATVTAGQRAAAMNNDINLPLAFGPRPCYLAPGVNAAGRTYDHIWSVYWFVARTNALLQRLLLAYDLRGEKIPMTPVGQALLQSTIQEQIDIAVARGHFRPDQFVFEFPNPIPTGDILAGDLKATVYITLESGAKRFQVTFNFSATDVVTEAP